MENDALDVFMGLYMIAIYNDKDKYEAFKNSGEDFREHCMRLMKEAETNANTSEATSRTSGDTPASTQQGDGKGI